MHFLKRTKKSPENTVYCVFRAAAVPQTQEIPNPARMGWGFQWRAMRDSNARPSESESAKFRLNIANLQGFSAFLTTRITTISAELKERIVGMFLLHFGKMCIYLQRDLEIRMSHEILCGFYIYSSVI